ncbi:DUF5788 family protein [Methanolobus mangrovi]|uniref:DUF5788 family protein n=1 Tax=Methanolobus mangrovi TaxID=3072977 RepID=A0AA51YG09_9EURY|nr:DUF5788 family protein [Methanolobus mangrovi]WMW21437.1 DUF5788 family protein [Methanolobus mangrovi]
MTENKEISDQERQILLNRLHKCLFWVGEQIPSKICIKGREVNLHEVVWEIVNKAKLDHDDLKNIDCFLELLRDKEKEYEECLEHEHLNCDEAKELFDRAAGVMRAIMDLKELTISSKRKVIFKNRHICKDVSTDEWDALTEDINKNER